MFHIMLSTSMAWYPLMTEENREPVYMRKMASNMREVNLRVGNLKGIHTYKNGHRLQTSGIVHGVGR